jgi:predicted DNA-binding transcriptional regulator AlpA
VGRRLDVDQLVGARDIAERLGLKHPQHVHSYRANDETFPEPVAQVGPALVWYWPEVERWARRTGRLERPKKG